MSKINGASVYVLFPSSPKNFPMITQHIISLNRDGEIESAYKIVDIVSRHIGKSAPPRTAIRSDGLALNLYFRNTSCADLTIKPIKSNPLLKLSKPEWEVVKAQIANPEYDTKNIEALISGATSESPKIICLNDMGYPQALYEPKKLPKSEIFSAIVILGLFCSLLAIIKSTRRISK